MNGTAADSTFAGLNQTTATLTAAFLSMSTTSNVPSATMTLGSTSATMLASTTAAAAAVVIPAELLSRLVNNTVKVAEMVELKANLNYFFLLICSILIFIMQTGFAFLEAGMIRTKNTVNIMLKNTFDTYISVLVYWGIGFSFAKGDGNSFVGHSWWFGTFPEQKVAKWYYEFCFACTAATIVSGALAERCGFYAYLVYSSCITGVVYPIVSRWVWYTNEEGSGQGGWLADEKTVVAGIAMQDFSGSGVVHLVAGSCALVGALFIGPRIGRFDERGNVVEIPGHSTMLSALGIFILMFGFFAFNGGSVLIITDPNSGLTMGRAIVNTMVSAASAAVAAMVLYKFAYAHRGGCCKTWKKAPWNFMNLLNGTLCGMACICAGCDVMEMWGAFCTGFVVGCIFTFLQWLVTYKLKIDDPCDVVAIHLGSGFWGLIAAPLFDAKKGVFMVGDKRSLLQLGVNVLGAVAIIAWCMGCCTIIFSILKYSGLLRVSPDEELKGMDIPEHGTAAYPAEAYGDGWGPSITADLLIQPALELEISNRERRKSDPSASYRHSGDQDAPSNGASREGTQMQQNVAFIGDQDDMPGEGGKGKGRALKIS